MHTGFWPAVVMGFCVLTCEVAADTTNRLSAAEKAAGWKSLFDGRSLQGWHSFKKTAPPSQGWIVEEGWLHCLGKGGDLISDAEYDNFELKWEWKLLPKANSGVKYFVTDSRDEPLGHEYQMIDWDGGAEGRKLDPAKETGAFYDVLRPSTAPPRKAGEINQSRIVVRGNRVEHWLNGTKVLEYECGSEAVKKAVAGSKFKGAAGFGNKTKGHLLLQEHKTEVWFRNVAIRELVLE